MISPVVKLGRSRRLVIFSDVHIGAEEHVPAAWAEALAWAKDEEATLILAGDILENAIISGSAPGEKLLGQALTPAEQVKEAARDLDWFAKKGRIAGVIRGNHEARSRREALLDLSDLLAYALKAPYWAVGGLIRIVAGGQVYPIGVHHGRSGAKNVWLELDRMFSLYPSAELVSAGHNHHLGHREVAGLVVGPDGKERMTVRHQIRSGSYLGYAEYVRELALPPGKIGSPTILFGAKEHEIKVDVQTLSWAG